MNVMIKKLIKIFWRNDKSHHGILVSFSSSSFLVSDLGIISRMYRSYCKLLNLNRCHSWVIFLTLNVSFENLFNTKNEIDFPFNFRFVQIKLFNFKLQSSLRGASCHSRSIYHAVFPTKFVRN